MGKVVAILPWDRIEECYAVSFAGNAVGQPTGSARIAVGCQIIKNWHGFFDERVTEEMAMNPYFQYFY